MSSGDRELWVETGTLYIQPFNKVLALDEQLNKICSDFNFSKFKFLELKKEEERSTYISLDRYVNTYLYEMWRSLDPTYGDRILCLIVNNATDYEDMFPRGSAGPRVCFWPFVAVETSEHIEKQKLIDVIEHELSHTFVNTCLGNCVGHCYYFIKNNVHELCNSCKGYIEYYQEGTGWIPVVDSDKEEILGVIHRSKNQLGPELS